MFGKSKEESEGKKAKKKVDDKLKTGRSLTEADRALCDAIKKAGLR